MIQEERIVALNNEPVRRGRKYVLYWMQAAQRTKYNHALEYAIQKANELKKPVLVLFCLTDNFPDANLRHYYFMLEGLKQVQADLLDKGIRMVIKHGLPERNVPSFSKQAVLTIVDGGQLRIQRQWRAQTAEKLDCAFLEVETNLIVPVEEASEKEEFSAGTFRPRITSKLNYYLIKLPSKKPKISSRRYSSESFDISNTDKALKKLKIDRSVGKVNTFHGGTDQAEKHLNAFLKNKLDKYSKFGNDPVKDCRSNMSPYLHFGQISPLYIALKVLETGSPCKDDYLEELIVRRELSHNFVFYNDRYDTCNCLPTWARRTLARHTKDKREYQYTLKQLESGRTHDEYWNAAQKEMVLTGKMHGYMRMYWGKKILEWSRSPQTAFKNALYLNNKYELDGRDPNGFAGIAWCFGKHDRAWSQRKIFGKVRYMNANGLKRKFDTDEYVRKIQLLDK
jgi:deoxyribodipyrimidine photo-lyase